MQTSTKQYIAFGDIAAFRFRCKTKNCRTELTLPLQEDYSRTHPADRCPNCGNPWLRLSDVDGMTAAPLLEQLVSSVRSISTWPGVCEIALEINEQHG